jgi:hypothetical protein
MGEWCEFEVRSPVNGSSRKLPAKSRRQETFTSTECGATAGGSGMAPTDAITKKAHKTKAICEIDFIPIAPVIPDFLADVRKFS